MCVLEAFWYRKWIQLVEDVCFWNETRYKKDVVWTFLVCLEITRILGGISFAQYGYFCHAMKICAQKKISRFKKKGKVFMATRRKTLCGHHSRGKILIDMEEVYRLIDKGYTRQEVADKFGVSVNTLYARHKEWQEKIEALGEDFDKEDFFKIDDDMILALPDDI